ncbi:hypothetical protein TCON_2516 [Astathelohania contejeani]|uniref:Uncharacterized protein n=1 Tax=Astathelohania contejeani TaxID=164912 RepID=A0ABQ7HVT0_9MICR|nr:hypothetical protein TCON_2516 [Thelohania contejeani]
MELKIKFLNKIKSNPTITEFQGTQKIPQVKVNSDIRSALNHITGEHIATNPPRTMCDVVRILQTVQWCYQEATSIKLKQKSPWYEIINNKISTTNSSIALLNKAKDRSKLSGTKTIEAKRTMRKLNLNFEKPHDLTEAIVSLKELIRIYSKKLEMYAKRKERKHEN